MRQQLKLRVYLFPVISILILLQPVQLFSRQDIRFERLSVEEGLSQSTVLSIAQDLQGFMWFATEDGLNRYDGKEFRIFKNDPEDPRSISGNDLWCLYVDRKGFLWIGAYSAGLNRYDPGTEDFTRFLHDPSDEGSISSDRVRSITEDSRGYLWVGTRGGGLNRLDPESGRFKRFTHSEDVDDGLLSDNVRFVMPDSGETLWIATSKGINLYDTATGRFSSFALEDEYTGGVCSRNVRHIFRDSSGIYWISTAKGLCRFDREAGRFTNFLHDPERSGSIGSDNIRNAYEDRKGRLWVATIPGGINLFNGESGTFRSFLFDPADPYSPGSNGVRVIFEDHGGLIWAGTVGGGISVYAPRTDRFSRYRSDPGDENSLADPVIWAVSEGPGGDLWFGTNSGIPVHYDRSEDRYRACEKFPNNREKYSNNYIRSLFWDNDGILWISGRYTGVDRFDPATGKCTDFHYDPDGEDLLSSIYVRYIYEDRDGFLWFCTWGGGVDRYDRISGRFVNFRNAPDDESSLCDDNTISILQDSDDIFWVATSAGLGRIEFSAGRDETGTPSLSSPSITNYYHDPADPQSISNSYVLSIHEAASGDLWFGTMQGLSRIRKSDRGAPLFERYFMKDGLPNDVIYGILEDSRGNLWISTNNGISCLDPSSGTFRNFNIKDGLQGNEFNSGAYTRSAEGTFIFGGVTGAVEFHPDSLSGSTYLPPVVLTGFSVFDKPAFLERSLSQIGTIVLPYRDNYFSFEFASLDYSAPGRNRYSYILEGLDDNWTNAGSRNFAGYTHVDPGEYIFKVKGTNSDGVWNEEFASVRIVITPPFWRTPWFITLVILAAGGSIAAIIVFRVRQLLKFERLRSRIAADLHDDIGAGLTEISIMGEVVAQNISRQPEDLLRTDLHNISETARSLIENMSDIVWLVDPRKDSLFDLMSRLGDTCKESLASSDIRFESDNLETLKGVRLDMEYRQNLYLIFREAINNALKHSECSTLSLVADWKGRDLSITLKDDGRGFHIPLSIPGNGLGNMATRASRIGGKLTIDSEAGSGTTINFRGPA